MSRRSNTILFFVLATIANLVIMLVIITTLFFLYMRFVSPYIQKELTFLPIIIILVVAIIATYIIYTLGMRHIAGKLDFEKHFNPIVKSFIKRK